MTFRRVSTPSPCVHRCKRSSGLHQTFLNVSEIFLRLNINLSSSKRKIIFTNTNIILEMDTARSQLELGLFFLMFEPKTEQEFVILGLHSLNWRSFGIRFEKTIVVEADFIIVKYSRVSLIWTLDDPLDAVIRTVLSLHHRRSIIAYYLHYYVR